MMASCEQQTDQNSPVQPGLSAYSEPSFERNGAPAEMQTWHCPYCRHNLSFRPEDRDVAELAVRSHMTRRHWDRGPQTGGTPCLSTSLIDLTSAAQQDRVPFPGTGTKPGQMNRVVPEVRRCA